MLHRVPRVGMTGHPRDGLRYTASPTLSLAIRNTRCGGTESMRDVDSGVLRWAAQAFPSRSMDTSRLLTWTPLWPHRLGGVEALFAEPFARSVIGEFCAIFRVFPVVAEHPE